MLFSKIRILAYKSSSLKNDLNILMIRHAQSEFNVACVREAEALAIHHLTWFQQI